MPLHYLGFGYAALVATGGIIGYAKAGKPFLLLLRLSVSPVKWGSPGSSKPSFARLGFARPLSAACIARLLALPALALGYLGKLSQASLFSFFLFTDRQRW